MIMRDNVLVFTESCYWVVKHVFITDNKSMNFIIWVKNNDARVNP